MDITLIDQPEQLDLVARELASAQRLALDCEAAGFHRYSDRLCLVQVTVPEGSTFLLDPLSVPIADALRDTLQDPNRQVVMHGADFDVRLLDRDLDIQLRGLFDTQIAASMLGIDGLGLQSLLERTLGVQLAKKYQRADWAKRPLPRAMLEYAALDTHHLLSMADRLSEELDAADRMEWAREEFREQEKVRHEPSSESDPVTRVKAARKLSDREVHRLREGLLWRDRVAEARDRAPFRVANDSVLVEVARENPDDRKALATIQGMNGKLAHDQGSHLLARLREVDALPDEKLRGLPPREDSGGGRPPPEVEDRMARLKNVRNGLAGELGIDRGTLLPNAQLAELAESPPRSLDDMRRVEGIRSWQAQVAGPALLEALARTRTSAPG